jgi:hypothetical protein
VQSAPADRVCEPVCQPSRLERRLWGQEALGRRSGSKIDCLVLAVSMYSTANETHSFLCFPTFFVILSTMTSTRRR